MKYESLDQEVSFEFQERKLSSWQLIESYSRLGLQERADKVRLCGTDLAFRAPIDHSGAPKLYSANFCKDRLCWMCSWRRTKKIFGQVSKVMDKLEADFKYRYVFVTLTLQNCPGRDLKRTLDMLASAFHLFNKRAAIKKAFPGAFRAFEVTYRPQNADCFRFHPHIHVIYACPESYFSRARKEYITQAEFTRMWRECIGSAYDPRVDVRIVKPSGSADGDTTFKQVVAEVAKYTVKPEELFIGRADREIDEAVWYLSGAFQNRRLCAFTGIFKKVAAELKLDDLNDGDLVNTDNEEIRTDVQHMLIHYKWSVGYGYERTFVTYEKEKEVEDPLRAKELPRHDRFRRAVHNDTPEFKKVLAHKRQRAVAVKTAAKWQKYNNELEKSYENIRAQRGVYNPLYGATLEAVDGTWLQDQSGESLSPGD